MNDDPKRIAIFRVGHIGDTIVALPALWTVRKRFPNAHIVFLTQENQAGKLAQGTEVLRAGTVYDEVLSYTLGTDGVSKLEILRTLEVLRRKNLDMVVYIPPFRSPKQLDRDVKFFHMAGVKSIVGIRGRKETIYYPTGNPLPFVTHEADILLKHLAVDGISVPDDPKTLMDLGLSNEERAFAKSWVGDQEIDLKHPVIGLGPGSKMTSKVWPVDRFIKSALVIDAEYKPTFIVFGGPSERDTCQLVCNSLTKGINVAGVLTVRQSAAVLEHCSMYLGNDTGTMHLAAAVGVPCVAVFSARDWPGRWYPYGDSHIVHRVAVPCEGCMLETCDRGNQCLLWIGTDEILESVRTTLDRETERGSGEKPAVEI